MSVEKSREMSCDRSNEISIESSRENKQAPFVLMGFLIVGRIEISTRRDGAPFVLIGFIIFCCCFYNGFLRITHCMHAHCAKRFFAAHPLFSWSLEYLGFEPLDEGMGINDALSVR